MSRVKSSEPSTAIQLTSCGSSCSISALAHVDEPRAPRRQQPLLRAAREDVDVRLATCRASAGRAPESRRRRSRRRARDRARRAPRDRRARRTRTAPTTPSRARTRSSSSSRSRRSRCEHAVVALEPPILDAAPLGELHPRIDVRRKLAVGRQHDVAALQRQRERREVDAERRVRRQRDLRAARRRSVDAISSRDARERAELELLRHARRIRAQPAPLVERGDRRAAGSGPVDAWLRKIVSPA